MTLGPSCSLLRLMQLLLQSSAQMSMHFLTLFLVLARLLLQQSLLNLMLSCFWGVVNPIAFSPIFACFGRTQRGCHASASCGICVKVEGARCTVLDVAAPQDNVSYLVLNMLADPICLYVKYCCVSNLAILPSDNCLTYPATTRRPPVLLRMAFRNGHTWLSTLRRIHTGSADLTRKGVCIAKARGQHTSSQFQYGGCTPRANITMYVHLRKLAIKSSLV
ncbi:uncharacterized protein B0H18DRAFT_960972 [Fomitopsis serialis]|uniref:uncharacterized protein n=1 Tax=Fomitopsis serialis TaxID=139415 RepID=UPI00200772F9|nr:uncharacterized protein B0H18DRAFT_960972 [Neoantrodia serialis]KAH9912546.1 hypothetical protein B0H18DRAFT_960972 [Neoantrodia serialis]